MDETLVHCEHSEMASYDHIIPVITPKGEVVQVNLHFNLNGNSNLILDMGKN